MQNTDCNTLGYYKKTAYWCYQIYTCKTDHCKYCKSVFISENVFHVVYFEIHSCFNIQYGLYGKRPQRKDFKAILTHFCVKEKKMFIVANHKLNECLHITYVWIYVSTILYKLYVENCNHQRYKS